MTPEPNTEAQSDLQLDVNHYVAALEQKNAQLLRENTVLQAVINQIQQQNSETLKQIDEVAAQVARPEHHNRVTTPKPRKNPRKKA